MLRFLSYGRPNLYKTTDEVVKDGPAQALSIKLHHLPMKTMMMLPSLVLAALFSVVSFVGTSNAAPSSWDGLDQQARDILARATPAAPHFVVYSDKYTPSITGPPPASQIQVCTCPRSIAGLGLFYLFSAPVNFIT
jgi:hypothetical protein